MISKIRKKMKIMIEETGVENEDKDISIKDLHERLIIIRKNWMSLKNRI